MVIFPILFWQPRFFLCSDFPPFTHLGNSSAKLVSDRELRCRSLLKGVLVLGEFLCHLAVAVVLDDLGAVSDEQLRVHQAVNLIPDGLQDCVSRVSQFTHSTLEAHLEKLGLLDALKQVVASTLLLHDIAGLVGLPSVSSCPWLSGLRLAYQNPNLLVGVLAGHTMGGELHQDGLGSHWNRASTLQNTKIVTSASTY